LPKVAFWYCQTQLYETAPAEFVISEKAVGITPAIPIGIGIVIVATVGTTLFIKRKK
jgi:hypothetical protein